MINRKPRIISQASLMPGDVIIIRESSRRFHWWQQAGISLYYFYQSLVSQKHGHYDNTHAAICIANDERGVQIAHVVNQGHEVYLANEYSLPGPFWVYRPRDAFIAATMASLAEPSESNDRLVWSGWEAFKTLITRSSYPDQQTEFPCYVSESTICSKFIVQVMQQAASTAYQDYSEEDRLMMFEQDPRDAYFPTISANSLPKTLESYLYQNDNYALYCCPGTEPLSVLRNDIACELLRIGEREDAASRTKFFNSCDAFRAVNHAINQSRNVSELDKALLLTSVMLPQLEVQTGFSWWGPTKSSAHVLATARALGIFGRDVRQVVLDREDEALGEEWNIRP